MREPEKLVREYYAAHGITHGAPLLFSYVRKSSTGGDWAIVDYYAAKFGHVVGRKGKDVVVKKVMSFNPATYRYAMSKSVVRYSTWSTPAMDHLLFDFHREISGAKNYSRHCGCETGGNGMYAYGRWEREIMPTSEIPLNDFSGTRYRYCKYRFKDTETCSSVIHSYRYWAKNPYGDLPTYLRKFDLNPRAMEMFAAKGLVQYMKVPFLLRLRDDKPFAAWYKRHALETLGLPIYRIEARARREIGETCYEICRKEERRLKRISDERKRVRRLRKQERAENARRIEAERREKRERKSRAMRILNLYRKLKGICTKYGAYDVRVPKSEAEMRREGKAMHNCIGKCYPALQGVDAIVVFIYKDGKPCVDVEVNPHTFEIVQCRTKCNKNAKKEAWRVARRVAQRIAEIYRKAA